LNLCGLLEWVERADFFESLALNAVIIPQGTGDPVSDARDGFSCACSLIVCGSLRASRCRCSRNPSSGARWWVCRVCRLCWHWRVFWVWRSWRQCSPCSAWHYGCLLRCM